MENNIVSQVYESLSADSAAIANDIAELNQLENEIKGHRYSDTTLKNEIIPRQHDLQQKISANSDRAISKARSLISEYRYSLSLKDALNPAEMTDDVKLLQPGLSLRERDFKAMLERNKGNRTMLQLIIRAAEERGVNLGVSYVGSEKELETADNLDSILTYYRRWIDQSDNKVMLDKFFQK